MIFWVGLGVAVGIVVGHIAVSDFQAVHGGAIFGVLLAHRVTLLCNHEMSHCIEKTLS